MALILRTILAFQMFAVVIARPALTCRLASEATRGTAITTTSA